MPRRRFRLVQRSWRGSHLRRQRTTSISPCLHDVGCVRPVLGLSSGSPRRAGVFAMAPFSPIPPRHPIRVVLSSTALLPFMSVRKAAALAIAQLGVAAFFISGVARTALGESAAWFVLAATVLAAFVRAIDIESWALLIPGGFVSRVANAFGPRAAGLAKAAALVERVLLGALACVVIGHYVASVSATAIAGWRFTGYVRPEDLATLVAVGVIALLWLPTRIGRDIGRDALARAVWIGVAILLVTITWGVVTLARGGIVVPSLAALPPVAAITSWPPLDVALAILLGFALVLPVVGGGEALARAAHELPPPRVKALRRTGLLTVLFAGVRQPWGHSWPFCWCPRANTHSGRMRRWPASRSTWPRLRRCGC